MTRRKEPRYPLWIPAVLILAIALVLGASAWPTIMEEITYLMDPASRLRITPANYPRIDSSTSTQPITALIYCKAARVECIWTENWTGEQMLAPNTPDEPLIGGFSGTHGAYENLVLKNADIIFVARPPSPDEIAFAQSRGVDLAPRPIALDAFVFIVNIQNPLPSISPEQVRDIYTGRITNWNQLGLTDGQILAYQRDRNSGSQELLDALVLKGERPVNIPEMVETTMFGPIWKIRNEQLALSYSVFYYANRIAPFPEVRVVAVNGVTPNANTIRSREYPFVTEVYAVIRADQDRESSAFLLYEWLLSNAGQQMIQETGYVPVR